jgi:hypothetical protein
MEPEIVDPRGEYHRICPFCFGEFIADHMNREFCPEKNGTKNWCKNRFKRLSANQKIEVSIQEEELTVVENNQNATRNLVVHEVELSQNKVDYLISNISIIGSVLKNSQNLKLHIDYLVDLGFVYDAYELKHQIPNTNLFAAIYGPYAIAWAYENHIVLTHKNQIPWIQ